MNWILEELDGFFYFIVERQEIWHRRMQQMAPPWTKDPILQQTHVTNVYREQDPGSIWVVKNILDNNELKRPSKAFWSLMYRYCGSNRHAWENVDLTPVTKFDPKRVAKQLALNGDPWGRAYLVFPMTTAKTGLAKIDQVCLAFEELAGRWMDVFKQARAARTAKASQDVIRTCRKGIADFTSYQGWLDMLVPNTAGEQLLRWSRNDYVVAGPGALKGLSNLAGEEIAATQAGQAEACKRIDWLWENQRQYMLDLGLKMIWLVDNRGQYQTLWKSDIQNCLCEWSKIVRVRDTGRITRKYEPAQ